MTAPVLPDLPAAHVGWRFDNSYALLPATLFVRVAPAEVSAPEVVCLNHALAETLGLDLARLDRAEAAALFAGQHVPEGALPIAQAYAGHQFGVFTMLGDGRAIVLGEHLAPDGRRWDVQFKGSGRTRFSRGGDGRAALGPMLREYIVSEAMSALGIPTTRSLAVVTTGERVFRDTPKPGAILTRIASSHLRVGTFQYAAARSDDTTLRVLADYAIARHDPEVDDTPDRYLEWLRAVARRQARLVAQWQLVGFVHGVMNTDNMAISGETIDYGPCAFLDRFHRETVFSSIDQHGRYAYDNQPAIAQWNLARFAEALLPLIDTEPERAVARATEVLHEFAAHFEREWLSGMRLKLGLLTEADEDIALVEGLLDRMQALEADFTNTFRLLGRDAGPGGALAADEGFRAWHGRWLARLSREGGPNERTRAAMARANPRLIPRNHRVEEALDAAETHGDLSVMERLLDALRHPYEDASGEDPYEAPPPPGHGPYRTFCGT